MEILKEIRKSRALPVLQTVRGISLTRFADEHLLRDAVIMTEGEMEHSATGQSYCGTTYITIDLNRRDVDWGVQSNHQLLIDAMSRSVLFRLRLMRIARREAERRCHPRSLMETSIHTEFRIEDHSLLIDINIECPIALFSNETDSCEEGIF
jgi:hypothetical protein